jgi:regulator of protease activity HflC (stomatin/prohibitin superfamily)
MIWLGVLAYLLYLFVFKGFYVVDQSERAVLVRLGRAVRSPGHLPPLDLLADLREEEKARYHYPSLRIIKPGGPYFKLPWEKVIKISVATQTVSMGFDPDNPKANQSGSVLEAVTKDQLNTQLVGQIRYKVSERNLYAYLFGLKNPLAHIMGYFVSVLRDSVANFEAKGSNIPGSPGIPESDSVDVSINDIRKNLRILNDQMLQQCRSSEARYGIVLDASLITGIDPPPDVESALAAINTAFNTISSEVSLAQAKADQTLMQSKRAVEIELLRAQAEVESLLALAKELKILQDMGSDVLQLYIKTVQLPVLSKAKTILTRST